MPLDVSHVDVVFSHFLFLFLGRATHFCTAGWHAAWVNRKKPGSKDRREDEMYLTNVPHIKYACMTSAIMFRLVAP